MLRVLTSGWLDKAPSSLCFLCSLSHWIKSCALWSPPAPPLRCWGDISAWLSQCLPLTPAQLCVLSAGGTLAVVHTALLSLPTGLQAPPAGGCFSRGRGGQPPPLPPPLPSPSSPHWTQKPEKSLHSFLFKISRIFQKKSRSTFFFPKPL